MKKHSSNRLIEIDIIRGIAIILMIVFHFFFDMHYLNLYSLPLINTPIWEFIRDVVAGIFILLVGISLYLSFLRVTHKNLTYITKKYINRGLKILSWGILLSIFSYLFISPIYYIRFGILHLIGASIIIMTPLLLLEKCTIPKYTYLLLGIIIILTGSILNLMQCSSYFIPTGCTPTFFTSLDYFPILPWFGYVLIGFWLGKILFKQEAISPNTIENTKPLLIQLVKIGQNSLIIYLLHQPIIFGLLYVLKALT